VSSDFGAMAEPPAEAPAQVVVADEPAAEETEA
jgi:hypothetical protein